MSFFGVEINAQVNRLINEIRLALQKNKWIPNFRTIYKAFISYDSEQSGWVSSVHFEKALNNNGLFFKKFEIQAFAKALGQDGNINWFEFMSLLRKNMTGYRSESIQKIFDFLDEKQQGKVHYSELADKFDVRGILQFQLGTKSKEAIQKQLLGLVPLTEDGCITKEQFYNFYNDLSVNISSDKVFTEFAASHWNYKQQKYAVPTKEEIKTAIKLIRFKLMQRCDGTHQEFLLKQIFDEFDINKNGSLSEDELLTMLIKLEIPTEQRMVKPLISRLDRNKNGVVEFDEFKNFLFFDPYPI